ncbi:hypothetical protein ACHAWF_015807 [Thalassiosira exigua]
MGQTQSAPESPAAATAAPASSPVQTTAEERPEDVAAAIERRWQPPPSDAASHNFGQPARPGGGGQASKQVTDCRREQRASLSCIEENYADKDRACAEFFEAYKSCRREEHRKKLEANAKASAW